MPSDWGGVGVVGLDLLLNGLLLIVGQNFPGQGCCSSAGFGVRQRWTVPGLNGVATFLLDRDLFARSPAALAVELVTVFGRVRQEADHPATGVSNDSVPAGHFEALHRCLQLLAGMDG